MDWTRTEITHLISLYRQYECLWNTGHEDYNNYDIKQNAWMDIAGSCSKEVDEVKKKLKNLRSAYVSEKKKSESSREHGIDYKPNLFYFNEFDFLDTVVILRKSTLPPSISQTFLSSRNKGDNMNIKQRKHKIVKVDRKSLRDSKFNNALDAILASVKQQTQSPSNNSAIEDDKEDSNNLFSSFGKTTALQLQQLPLDKATETMSAIYQLVAKKTLESLKKSSSGNKQNIKRTSNGIISFETMSP